MGWGMRKTTTYEVSGMLNRKFNKNAIFFKRENESHGRKNMKRILTVGALIVGLSLSVGPQAWANQLLGNPGFEDRSLNNWTPGGPNWIAENTVKFSGAWAAQNTIGTLAGDYYSPIYQTKVLSPGQTVYATVQAMTDIDPRSSAVAGLKIDFLDAGGQPIPGFSKQAEIGGLTDWRQLYVSATAPTGTVNVKLSLFAYAVHGDSLSVGGLAYFDDAVLSTDSIPAPPRQVALINPGFENGLHDWNLIYSPAFSVDNQNHQEGSLSAKATVPTHSGTFFSSASQDLQYLLGGILYGSAYIKTSLNGTTVANLLFEYYNQFDPPVDPNESCFDSVGTCIGRKESTTPLQGVNPWTRVFISDNAVPAGTVMVRVHVFVYDPNANGANGTANFDDVIFSYSPLTPPDFRINITNPGFENSLNGWSDQYGFPAVISTINHTGGHSAQKTIHVLNPPRDYYSQIYQDIYYDDLGTQFPDNTPVYATAYVKTAMTPTTKSKGGLQFEFIDNQGRVITDAQDVPIVVNDAVGGNTDWRYLYVTRLTPAGTYAIRVSGFEFARQADASWAGDAYYDDFLFSKNTPLTPPAPQTSLINANFENGLNDWDELYFPGEVVTSPVHGGIYAAVFTVSDTVLFGNNYFGAASQDISVSANHKVTASVWANTSIKAFSEAAAGVSLTFFNANGQQVGAVINGDSIGEVGNYQLLTVSSNVPSGAVKVRFASSLFAPAGDIEAVGDKAYFDDASLTITTLPIGCFLAGTPITMADGSQKPIEEMKVGDMVLAYDEATKQMKPDKVTEIFKHDQEDTFLIVNGHIKVTPIHRVLSKGNWVEIGKLKVGDTLTNTKGEDVAIQTIEVVNNKVNIYNFEVNPYHTYVADGVIVHNRKIIPPYTQWDGNGHGN